MDLKKLAPPAGIMKLYCKTGMGNLSHEHAMLLYRHSRGILEDTPIGDPAYIYFHNQHNSYQKLCLYMELLNNPDSKNIALTFQNASKVYIEILEAYGIKYVPLMKVCIGGYGKHDYQGLVIDIHDPEVSEQNRAEALEFLSDYSLYANLVYKPLYFS